MTSHRHHQSQRRVVWPPEPGLFAFRFVRNGWRVPAEIIRDDDGWHVEIDGEAHAAHPDPTLAPMLSAVWHSGLKLPEADYRWLQAIKTHALASDPDHPCLHPRKPMKPELLKPIIF